MRHVVFIVGVALGLTHATVADGQTAALPEPTRAEINTMLRSFLTGICESDQQALEAVMLPDEQADMLWRNAQPLTDAQRAELGVAVMLTHHRRLHEGDEVTLLSGDTLTVREAKLDGRLAIQPTFIGLVPYMDPLLLTPYDNGQTTTWRIDATPLIQAQLRAQAMRERRAAE